MSNKRKELEKLVKELPDEKVLVAVKMIESLLSEKSGKRKPKISGPEVFEQFKHIPESERFRKAGRAEGTVKMSDDFDDPIEGFEEYM